MSIDDSLSSQTESAYQYHNQYKNTKKFVLSSQMSNGQASPGIDDSSKIFELINKLNDNMVIANETDKPSDEVRVEPPDLISTTQTEASNELSKSNNDIQSLNLTDGDQMDHRVGLSSSLSNKLDQAGSESPNGAASSKPSSRIPRIPYLHNGGKAASTNETATTTPAQPPAPAPTPSNTKPATRPSKMRAPRSLSKSSSASTRTHTTQEAETKTSGGVTKPVAASAATTTTTTTREKKRGVSLVFNREQSFTSVKNESTENLSGSVCSGNGIGAHHPSSGSEGGAKKTVKYVFRHKPKESHVV
jgi:hypothetical protein